MESHSDWLTAHGIRPPNGHAHLQCLAEEYPDLYETFTSVGMEQEVRFENIVRRPILFGQFASEAQLLGEDFVYSQKILADLTEVRSRLISRSECDVSFEHEHRSDLCY